MSLVGAYDSDSTSEEEVKQKKDKEKKKTKKSKKKKKSKKPAKDDENDTKDEEQKPKLSLPSAAALLDAKAGTKASFLIEDEGAVEGFIDHLNESDLALQTSKPKNTTTAHIARTQKRKIALERTRNAIDEKFAELQDKREYMKATAWKKVCTTRKDEHGNEIRAAPIDPRGKSIHKWH